MRTKTLLLTAAALVAGLASSQAQSNVYSVNIVGYVNTPLTAGQQALLANPLDDGTNTITSLDKGLPNKSTAQIWNGVGFTGSVKAAGSWSPNLSIPPGTGFFVKPFTVTTNLFIGSSVLSNNAALPGGVQTLAGSTIPFSGALNDAGPNTLNLGPSLPNKSTVQTWNGTGYVGSVKAAGTFSPNLSIGVAQGFFVKPFAATTWSVSKDPVTSLYTIQDIADMKQYASVRLGTEPFIVTGPAPFPWAISEVAPNKFMINLPCKDLTWTLQPPPSTGAPPQVMLMPAVGISQTWLFNQVPQQ